MVDGQQTREGSKNDFGKERFDLIPPQPLFELANLYAIGARKYEDRNWEKGLKWGRVFAAMMRHAWKFWGGEFYDRECLNSKCVDENGVRTILPKEAGKNRLLKCNQCGDNGVRAPHLASVAWCAFTLLEYTNTHQELDDRSV